MAKELFLDEDISELTAQAFLDYAVSTIVSRSLPDIRDGLKPVHRRIIWASKKLGATPKSKKIKCGRIVGETIGVYHPYGDAAVYEALVRLGQNFITHVPVIDKEGNFGSQKDPKSFAAPRYCITGDSLVQLADKSLIRIDSIVPDSKENSDNDIDIEVLDYQGNKVHASKLFNSGYHQVRSVRLRSGFVIKGTLNHPILIIKKDKTGFPVFDWKLLEDIDYNDKIITLKKNFLEKEEITKEEKLLAIFLGGAVSEGYLSGEEQEYYRFGFSNQDKNFYDLVLAGYKIYLETENLKNVNIREEFGSGNVYQFCSEQATIHRKILKEIGRDSYTRKIPEIVFKSSISFQKWFLKALFEGDGCVSIREDRRRNNRKNGSVSYTTYSLELADAICLLLANFGIRVSRTNDRIGCKLDIGDLDNLKNFRDKIGFLSERKSSRLNEAIEAIESRYYSHRGSCKKENIPYISEFIRENVISSRNFFNLNNVSCIRKLSEHKERIIKSLPEIYKEEFKEFFDEIKNYSFEEIIEIADYEEPELVYSIKVDSDDHSFIANGFINHNTEARLSYISDYLLADIEVDTVADFVPNYDNSTVQPAILPTAIPYFYLASNVGIAVGFVTNAHPFNPSELVDGTIAWIKNPKISYDGLFKVCKGPDFPTGGIVSQAVCRKILEEGRGVIVIRSPYEIKDDHNVVFTEMPYLVAGETVIDSIANAVNGDAKNKVAPTIPEIKSVKEIKNQIYITIKRGENIHSVINKLYKYTFLQYSLKTAYTGILDGKPVEAIPFKDGIKAWYDFRFGCVTRKYEELLRIIKKKLHIIAGMKKIFMDPEKAIRIIKNSKSKNEAGQNLMKAFGLDEIQVAHILEMKVYKFSKEEIEAQIKEEGRLKEEKVDYEDILKKPSRIQQIIIDKLLEFKKKFGCPRRTKLSTELDGGSNIEGKLLVPKEACTIFISQNGYIKRVNDEGSSGVQKKGGRGRNVGVKEDDYIKKVLSVNSHDELMILTNQGRCFKLPAYEIELTNFNNIGKHCSTYLDLKPGELVRDVLSTPKYSKDYILITLTRKGYIKGTTLDEYANMRSTGILAMTLEEGDKLVDSQIVKTKDLPKLFIYVAQSDGKVIKFTGNEIPQSGRTTRGHRVTADITAEKIQMYINDIGGSKSDDYIILITSNGMGKRVETSEIPMKHRGSLGAVIGIRMDEGASLVGIAGNTSDNDELVVVSNKKVLRCKCKDISILKRPAFGSRVMKLEENETVVSYGVVNFNG